MVHGGNLSPHRRPIQRSITPTPPAPQPAAGHTDRTQQRSHAPTHTQQPANDMPAKGKGKRKVTAGPMDPRKTREPVTGHPDTDLNAALDSIMLSPPHTDAAYDSDSSMITTTTAAPPPPTTAAAPLLRQTTAPLPAAAPPAAPTSAKFAITEKWLVESHAALSKPPPKPPVIPPSPSRIAHETVLKAVVSMTTLFEFNGESCYHMCGLKVIG